ncbi:hypothetical protein [Streptomyces sp. NPDC048192]|jgi:hypothetical protein|uniref:hypothetical protein n=1 Tax=unclassified Streptomyces TaxID=2593676 RepID=UPI003713BA0B
MPTGSGASEQQQLPQAQQQLQQDQTAYNQAVAQDGVMVPASEMAFVPSLPARITALPVATGDKVNGAVVSLSTGGLKLTGYLDPSQGSLVKPGMRANITSESLGLSASGTVASVGSLITPGDKHNDGQVSTGSGDQSDQSAGAAVNDGNPYRPLVVTAKAWDKRLDGQNVRITITAAATSAPVLTVPEAAIDSGADTKATVTVVASDGTQHTVQVTAGVSANGDVEVEPVSTGALRAGDRVVIGQ